MHKWRLLSTVKYAKIYVNQLLITNNIPRGGLQLLLLYTDNHY